MNKELLWEMLATPSASGRETELGKKAKEFMDQGQAYRTLKEDNIRMLSKVNDPSVYRVHAEGYRYKNYGLINHLNTISGYYSITAKCVTDTIKGYDTLGMQYADKYKGVDQRLGLLSLA